MTDSRTSTKLRLPLWIAGAVTGLMIAAAGMVEKKDHKKPDTLPAGNIARVGDTLIPISRYAVLLDDLSADKRNPLTNQDRKFALDRLIDEELLIQRGVELGLASNAPAVRKAIASAVISQVVADASTTLPDEVVLREFYLSAHTFFSSPGQFHVRWWKLDDQQADAMRAAADQGNRLGHGGDRDRAAGTAPDLLCNRGVRHAAGSLSDAEQCRPRGRSHRRRVAGQLHRCGGAVGGGDGRNHVRG